jgi:ribonuclease J
VPVEEDKDEFIEDACDAAEAAARKSDKDEGKLREAIRLAVRRKAVEWTGKKPVVDVLVLKV